MAPLEEGDGQADEVADEVARELEGDRLAQRQHDPGAQRLDERVEEVDAAEADREEEDEVDVALADRLVDDQLLEEGERERGQLEEERQTDDLRHGAL